MRVRSGWLVSRSSECRFFSSGRLRAPESPTQDSLCGTAATAVHAAFLLCSQQNRWKNSDFAVFSEKSLYICIFSGCFLRQSKPSAFLRSLYTDVQKTRWRDCCESLNTDSPICWGDSQPTWAHPHPCTFHSGSFCEIDKKWLRTSLLLCNCSIPHVTPSSCVQYAISQTSRCIWISLLYVNGECVYMSGCDIPYLISELTLHRFECLFVSPHQRNSKMWLRLHLIGSSCFDCDIPQIFSEN